MGTYDNWLTKSYQCPTAVLSKTNGLLTSISKTEPSQATMEWESRSSSNFIIHSEVSGSNGADVVDIVHMLHSSYKEAHRLLYSDILEHLSPRELGFHEMDDIFAMASKDQAMFNVKGYGLSTGAFNHLQDGLLLALLKSEKSQEVASVMNGKLQFNTAILSKKLGAVENFLECLFPVVHILGLPKRGTELECCQVLNSEQRPRNVKAYFNQIVIGGGYNKTSGITGKDSQTLHMFPKPVEELLLTYLALVHPFQARVVPMVVKNFDPNFSDFLWASKGQKWSATRFTKILREKTRGITSNGIGFGLHDIRHISAGINDHYDLKRPEIYNTADHVADLSSGHRTATAEGAYAITPQQDQQYSQSFVYNCQDFFKKLHYLFGFDGNLLQLRSEQDLWTISRGKENEVQSFLLLQKVQAEVQQLMLQQDRLSEHLDQAILGQMQFLQSRNSPGAEFGLGQEKHSGSNMTPTKLHSSGHATSISMATPSPRALGKVKAMDSRNTSSGPHVVTNLSSIVKAKRDNFHSQSSLLHADIEVIQSALQHRNHSPQGRTVEQRLQFALKSVPRMSGNHLVCCECDVAFPGANSAEMLFRHFLMKSSDEKHTESHKLCLSLKLEGRGKSAKYYRMDKHGNFGFICEAFGCAKYLANATALKEHIQGLSAEEVKVHARRTYKTFAKKAEPYHHLGTTRIDFDAEGE